MKVDYADKGWLKENNPSEISRRKKRNKALAIILASTIAVGGYLANDSSFAKRVNKGLDRVCSALLYGGYYSDNSKYSLEEYEVQPGDTLTKIVGGHNPRLFDYITRLNRVNAGNLVPGQSLHVPRPNDNGQLLSTLESDLAKQVLNLSKLEKGLYRE